MVVVCINTHNTIIPFDPFHLVHLTPLYTPPAAAAAALAPFPPTPFFFFFHTLRNLWISALND